ncbi:uncharacterized protein (DUF1810 family) [Pedobacter sp. CAN_A7]|uniref:DUF1810 domain-containing protein n=1 Tax=Pedobacter sp. CAN_A7 TaxID=2787722 RepID=UPI001A1F0F18
MMENNHLERFVKAQQKEFEAALSEVKNGRKQSHWMWYIYPQLQGLGFSETTRFYAIKDIEQAKEYLEHQILGARLVLISEELLKLDLSARQVFGSPDDLKLHSSMTLFAEVQGANPIFEQVLQKFFKGQKDNKTLSLLRAPFNGNS